MAKYSKTIVVLANSRKISGRCIAGKTIQTNGTIGDWIRPVSSRQAGELSEKERQFSDGTDPKLLDVVEIQMHKPVPHGYQTENHEIDDKVHWVLKRKATAADVKSALDTSASILWDNSAPDTANGKNDRVDDATAAKLKGSLLLIEIPKLTVSISIEGAGFSNAKRKVRGAFKFRNVDYILMITDPVVEREYLKKTDGQYDAGPATLCISLGELFQGYAYKLIAGVIFPK
ncbi:dual OB domain-containing protein [Bradyrhizobium oligotrophicum]|uniref:dual OB domain-containing protein n=1 Tax=Bradyrhizobium oligotrophicum TaxID=44255 RepID=UPI003EBC7EBD